MILNPNKPFTRFAVILGLLPPGLSVVRELGKKNIPLLGIAQKGASEIGSVSKYLHQLIEYRNFDDLLIKLLEFVKTQKEKPILMPMRDDYLFFISDNYELLTEQFEMQGAYEPSSIKSMVDKKYFYKNLQKTTIPIPKTWILEDLPEYDISNHFKKELPLIAKPRCIHKHMRLMRRNKVFLLNNRIDLENFLNRFKESLSEWLIQDIIPGPSTSIYVQTGYVSKRRDHLIHFNGRKLKQLPEDFGVAAKMISEKNKTIETLTLKLLTHLNYHGVYDTEFKWDKRDNTFKLMEINPRSPLWIGISTAAGRSINYASYLDICNIPNEEISQSTQKTVIWTYQEKCLISTLKRFTHLKKLKNNKKYSYPSPQKTTGPIWNISDPIPMLNLLPFYLKKLGKRVKSLLL